ncbi:serine/threonine-protein kinase [Chamaesiphon minutus]|uniref:non-specific serine/threonine protein kinase n=1 Tax=Chamaesiphon minutus (strain ATCC 27169 / PCC 6605) TaxID=1173020 RepID=K9UL21_CHAP6|nr:serine/threonine-protein kinase [Chamaesiphon minutus]AFY95530.1 serine/threonine protein kinase [Chamaesiphon minutus PCC 6605]
MIESSLLTPGNILGNRYEIVRELGRGGFGRTYLAIDRNKFGEQCVLKEFAPQVSGKDDLIKAKELFEREAGVLYKLQHPQIPAFRELLRVNERGAESLFLIQDYIEGETYLKRLNHRLSQNRVFNEGEVIELLHKLLPVLDYIHRLGVIHRDISPDNIIYRDRDRLPILIDFGCVKEVAATVVYQLSHAKVETRIGKQGYAPEEQMMRGKVSPSSDLYAVGATALTLLTGKDANTLYNPAEASWDWRKYVTLSPELTAIIDRLLKYNPQHRYQSAQEVLAVLPAVANNSNGMSRSVHTFVSTNSIPATHVNKISQLKTLEFSPRSNTSVAPTTTQLPTRDPNEWKKPAWQVTKVMSVLFFTCLAISGVVKWVQASDPIGTVTKQFNNATASIVNSIPNPLKAQPSVQQRQQDLSQKLKQLNIPAAKFYRQVDREFYAKHPELNGRMLTTKAEDEKLRQEWQDLAVEMLAKRSR